jgi:hypothetical protein
MHPILEKNNYLVVDFINPQYANILYQKFKQRCNKNPDSKDGQCPLSISFYNYKPFLELLVHKVFFMNKLMGEPMLPTYAYARIYKNGEVLTPHTDRPACEISVTLHLGGDKEWPIWFTDPQGNKVPVNLKSGQAAIYKGIVSEHWRETFEGTEYGQVFLHYVKSHGEHWRHFFDRAR